MDRSGFLRCKGSHRTIVSIFLWTLLLSFGCSDEDDVTRPDISLNPRCGRMLVVTAGAAFEAGSVAIIDVDSSFTTIPDLSSIHSDATARFHDGFVYVINRSGADNIQVLDPLAGFSTIRQFSVGVGTNPHDIVFVSESRAYVSRYGSASLLEVDPRNGSTSAEVSLSALADADGIPEMDRMYYRDPYLYVAIQRLDFRQPIPVPVPPSYLAVIDTRDNELVDCDSAMHGVQGIVLDGLNPSAPMIGDENSGSLLVPAVGIYGELDGGVEKVDLDARESRGWLVREEDLGGDLLDFVLTDGGPGYAIITSSDFVTTLVAFDPATGTKLGTVFASDGFELSDLQTTACGHLLVCDRDFLTPGIRVFDAQTGEPVAVDQPISTGLPPLELIALEVLEAIR